MNYCFYLLPAQILSGLFSVWYMLARVLLGHYVPWEGSMLLGSFFAILSRGPLEFYQLVIPCYLACLLSSPKIRYVFDGVGVSLRGIIESLLSCYSELCF